MSRHIWIGIGMTLIGTVMLALRNRAFWVSDIIYHRETPAPSSSARMIATLAGVGAIVLGILAMLNVIPV